MEKAYEELVSSPAARATSTTATPISTALSLTATSSHSHSSGDASNDAVDIGDANNCGSADLCPAAANGAAHAGRRALEQEMLYRVDLQVQGAATAASVWATGGDRRKRRMIKNRESAARSRARKQAYVHELEKEVRLLRAENDALREQCEELKKAAEVQVQVPVPLKKTLQRVSSAPF